MQAVTTDDLIGVDLQMMQASAEVRRDRSLVTIPDGSVGERYRRLALPAEVGAPRPMSTPYVAVT